MDDAPPNIMEAPDKPASLYADQGDVSPALPVMQGDVFRDISLPGHEDQPPDLIQIVMHPCSMRGKGGALTERVTVAPVRTMDVINSRTWQTSGKYMPLPELLAVGEATVGTHFIEITSVPSASLGLSDRVAALSRRGLLILQQRLVWFHSRFIVPTSALYRQSSPVLTELELQADWVEEAIAEGDESETESIVKQAAEDFQVWLSEDKNARRKRLFEDANHADLRAETRKEIERRYRQSAH